VIPSTTAYEGSWKYQPLSLQPLQMARLAFNKHTRLNTPSTIHIITSHSTTRDPFTQTPHGSPYQPSPPELLQPSDARSFKSPFDPFQDNPGWSSKSSLAGHLNANHVRAHICPPNSFLSSMNMWVCKACWTLHMERSGCKVDRCAGLEPSKCTAQAALGIAAVAPEPILAEPSDTTPST
jgi:hypothetical protein